MSHSVRALVVRALATTLTCMLFQSGADCQSSSQRKQGLITALPNQYPKPVRLLMDRAQRDERYFNYSAAIDDYNQAIALLPKDPKLFQRRAWAYRMEMRYAAALADYTKAIALLDHSAGDSFLLSGYYRDRGDVYFITKKFKEAVADDTMAIKLHYSNAGAFMDRERAYEALGDFANAIADCKSALPYADNHTPGTYYRLGNLYLKTKQYKEAVDAFSHQVQLQSDLSEGYYGRAKAYECLGEKAKAAADTKKGHDLDMTY